MYEINKDKQAKLEKWLHEKINEAKEKGEPMFLGVPDNWYEKGLHCCNSGHIFTMYLKSSLHGNICFDCKQPSHIFPSDVTHEEFDKALS